MVDMLFEILVFGVLGFILGFTIGLMVDAIKNKHSLGLFAPPPRMREKE